MASGKFTSMNSNVQLQGSWESLVTFLNSLEPNGKEKDVKSWKTVSTHTRTHARTIYFNIQWIWQYTNNVTDYKSSYFWHH